jgi:excisionase family DNA binding protein
MSEWKESLTVREVAREMAVTDATVRVWINTGKLPAYKLPGSGAQSIIRIKRDDFEKFLRAYRSSTVCA